MIKPIFIKKVKPYIYPKTGWKLEKALFLCNCGNKFEGIINSVKRGHPKSCGCLGKNNALKHGYHRRNNSHQLYSVWQNMKRRCYDINSNSYQFYGKRGIKICKEWFDNAGSFIEWSINNGYKKGLTIDRINNDGNYEPSNCRYSTYFEQARNKRNNKLSMELVTEIKNIKLLIPNLRQQELAKAYNISQALISRILSGKRWGLRKH